MLGKLQLQKKLSQKYPNIKISISHTTRKPRSNEIDGVDYHFVTKINLKSLLKKIIFMNMLKYLTIIMEHQKSQ